MPSEAVERWKNTGVIDPERAGEVAAYIARRARE